MNKEVTGGQRTADGDGTRDRASSLQRSCIDLLISGVRPSPSAVRCPLFTARKAQRGVTLIELVISITIIAIAVSAVLAVMSKLSVGSAEALVRHQAVAIGDAYLEEALLKPFDDPDGVDGESARAALDDVNDYHGLIDNGARDQFDNALSGLDQYVVAVSVVNGSLGAISAVSGDALRVDVSVTHPSGLAMTFSGYRTRY